MEREPQVRTRIAGEPLQERAPLVAPEPRDGRARAVSRLFTAWVLWWVAVVIGWAWPELPTIWGLLRGTREHGRFSLTIDAGFGELALWLALPPLLITLVWLFLTRRRR